MNAIILWERGNTVETVCLLSKLHADQTMNLLDNAINEGNTLKFKEYTDTLSEIVTQLCPKDVLTKKIEMKFTITPGLANPSISTMFGIPIKYNKKER